MKKIKPRFKSLLLLTIAMAVLLLTGCPVAPPTEPMDQYKPYLAPEAVKTLTATNGYEDSISLKWDEVPNATSYQVWKIKASDYGAVSNIVTGDTSYHKLKARGFELMTTTENTSYKMDDCKHNEAYVFTVIAMRSVGYDNSKKVLFSDIGNFVEGSTIGDIAFTAVSLSDEIILSWQVNNLYDVLYTRANDPSAAANKPLFDNYSFTVSYRTADDSSFMPIAEGTEGNTEEMRRINILDNGLRLNTQYYFKVAMSVFDGSKEIGHIESFEFPVYTTSKFSISAIDSVAVSEGTKTNAVDVTWRAPSVPLGVDYENVFEVQRSVESAEPEWITVLSVEDFKSHKAEIATAEEKVYTWSDTTVAENTKYKYRVVNGYVIDDKNVMQDRKKPVTESKTSGYSLWRPTEITGTFVPGEGENPNNGTLTITWKLDVPQKDATWELSETKWYEKDYSTTTAVAENALVTSDGAAYTCTYNVSVADVDNLSVFTYKLNYKFGDETLSYDVATDKKVSLGKSTTKVLFTDFTASNDLVGKIKLQWKLDPQATDEPLEGNASPYVLWEDGVEKEVVYGDIVKGADGLRSYEMNAASAHDYRLKLTGSYGGNPVSDYACPDTVTGNVLAVPAGLNATDSTSRDEITVTWDDPKNASVVYTLEYREKGTEVWAALPIDTATGTVSISKETITAEKAGAVYEFRMKASNKAVPDEFTEWTAVEEGSIFGTYGMDLSVVDNGLDPEAINLKWNPVVGAGFYKIVRDGQGFSGNGSVAASFADSKVAGLKPDESNPVPLSKEYTYKVIPYMTREEADADRNYEMSGSAVVTGKLFAPPVGIKATKGEFTKEIHVTWDPVVIEGQEISYEVFKYLSADVDPDKDKPFEAPAAEFVDKIATDGVYYAVRTVRKTPEGELVKSHWQNSFDEAVNEVGEKESANYGYRLNMPSSADFTVNTVTTAAGKYADYVKLVWKRVPGATEYRIYSSILDANGSDVPLYVEETEGVRKSVFTVDDGTVLTNGKKPDEAGYLSYDKATQLFTYNDDSGVMTDTVVINGYGVAAKNGNQITGKVEEGTGVYRMFKPEECVNMVNHVLNPLITAADTAFKHDWWGSPSADNYDGKNGFTVERYSETASGTWFSEKNLMKLADVKHDEFTLKTTVPIQYFINYTYDGWAGYLGTDTLNLIGNEGKGVIQVTHPKYETFSVGFNSIKYDEYTGTYNVTIGAESIEVKDNANINRPFVEVGK